MPAGKAFLPPGVQLGEDTSLALTPSALGIQLHALHSGQALAFSAPGSVPANPQSLSPNELSPPRAMCLPGSAAAGRFAGHGLEWGSPRHLSTEDGERSRGRIPAVPGSGMRVPAGCHRP